MPTLQRSRIDETHPHQMQLNCLSSDMDQGRGTMAIWPTIMAQNIDRPNNGNWMPNYTKKPKKGSWPRHNINKKDGTNKTATNNRVRGQPSDLGPQMQEGNQEQTPLSLTHKKQMDKSNKQPPHHRQDNSYKDQMR